MVDRHLIRELAVDDAELEAVLGSLSDELELNDAIYSERAVDVNAIITGKILRIEGNEVLVDIGFKSEGIVLLDEWGPEEEQPEADQDVQVLLEEVEDEFGLILLSKRKADRIREWEKVIATHSEGDVIIGKVVRKIKGGLLVHIGVNVFLPASQVDIRRPPDIGDYIGKDIECVILKIDDSRRNIVVSRRKLIEDKRESMKRELLEVIEEGQLRTGVVKNIADFGAFVDLGGIDGLLHITDMSWGRISHPSVMVKIDDEIEVVILNVDREKEKIALGLKQKSASPWDNVAEKYPVATKITGEVVNVMSYGAFVKLEDGIEGLVHISEMSWTKRINHPSELVEIGDNVEVMVLGINQDKQEISLGIKQTQSNPWDDVAAKYPADTVITGTVRNLTNYGAFIELEEGVDGLLHVSDMSWTRKISHANEMLKKGDQVECQVLSVDEDRKRIALGLKQLAGDPWETRIPEKYHPGVLAKGTVTKITNFGVFVELESELEGLLHISELADHKVENPEDEVEVGEEIEVRILRVDTDDRKIGLSRRLDAELPVEGEEGGSGAGDSDRPDAPRKELKGGIGGSSTPLFSMDTDAGSAVEEAAAESAPEAEETAEPESDAAEEVAEPSAEVADDVEETAAEETEEAPAAESDTAEETSETAAETVEAEESDQADEPVETDESESTDEEEKQD